MRIKGVTTRLEALDEVRASHTHRDHIAGRLERRPAFDNAFPDGTEAVSYRAQFDHLDQELVIVGDGLRSAEDEHVRRKVVVAQVQRRSDEDTAKLFSQQTSARQVLAGLYGSEYNFELAAISGKTPQSSGTLAEQVDQTVKLLRAPVAAEPAKKVTGVTFDFEAVAAGLEDGLVEVRGTRAGLKRARKSADKALVAKQGAMDEYDLVFPWVARTLESLFRLAGEHELADRIRRSLRRVTHRRGEEGEEAPSEEAPAESSTETTIETTTED